MQHVNIWIYIILSVLDCVNNGYKLSWTINKDMLLNVKTHKSYLVSGYEEFIKDTLKLIKKKYWKMSACQKILCKIK